MSFCLHVPSSHSVPSFAHTTARPLTCTCTACLQPRFQGAQALTMRSGSWLSLCIWFPLHHNLLSCLLMSSSLCLLCAHTCTFVRPQVFGPLTWGARVCVCVCVNTCSEGFHTYFHDSFSRTVLWHHLIGFPFNAAGGCRGFPWSASNEDTMDFL